MRIGAEEIKPDQRRDYDDELGEDTPEWTDEDFANAKSVWDFPDLVEMLQKEGKLGRRPCPMTSASSG